MKIYPPPLCQDGQGSSQTGVRGMTQMEEHRDICIRFRNLRRPLKAVGFLREGEGGVSGQEALARVVARGNRVVADVTTLAFGLFPEERLGDYQVVTACLRPRHTEVVECFTYNVQEEKRSRAGKSVGSVWDAHVLVLCHDDQA